MIEPPYAPLCTESRDGSTGSVNPANYDYVHPGFIILSNIISAWGGDRSTHEEATERAWKLLVDFLKANLVVEPTDTQRATSKL